MSRLQTNAIRHLGSVVDNLTFDNVGRVLMPNQPAFMAGGNVNADATYAAGATVAMPAKAFDTGSNYNTSNSRFTAPVAGVYNFYTSLYLTASGGVVGFFQFGIAVNGAFTTGGFGDAKGIGGIYINNAAANVLAAQIGSSLSLKLAAGDYVEVKARSQIRVYEGHGFFYGHLVG